MAKTAILERQTDTREALPESKSSESKSPESKSPEQNPHDNPAWRERAHLGYMTVTPAMATEWLRGSKYDGQRKIQRRDVTRYASQMERGDWGRGEAAIVFGLRSSGEHLMNGQHRLTAVVLAGKAQVFLIERRVYESDQEMDRDFSLMDQGKKRTTAQALKCLNLGDRIGVPDYFVVKCLSALGGLTDGFAKATHARVTDKALSSMGAKEDLLMSWQAPIHAYYRAHQQSSARSIPLFQRIPVIAIALLTFDSEPKMALEFWETTAKNNGLKIGEPEHTLRHVVLSDYSPSDKRPNSEKNGREELYGNDWYARCVAKCWNAYYQNHEVTDIRGVSKAAPLIVLGTPMGRDANPLQVIAGNRRSLPIFKTTRASVQPAQADSE